MGHSTGTRQVEMWRLALRQTGDKESRCEDAEKLFSLGNTGMHVTSWAGVVPMGAWGRGALS